MYKSQESRRSDVADACEPQEDALILEPYTADQVVKAFAAFDGLKELRQADDGRLAHH